MVTSGHNERLRMRCGAMSPTPSTRVSTPSWRHPRSWRRVRRGCARESHHHVGAVREGRATRSGGAAQPTAAHRGLESGRRVSPAERDGRDAQFPEVLALAAEALDARAESGGGHLADHVIVDEAQDLHATHWALLRALVAEGPNDLFIAEDSHQRIYGSPIVLGRFGIKIVGRSRRLTLNYRTTAQNLAFAVDVLSGAQYTDLEQGAEKTSDYRSARTGPEPEMIPCENQTAELEAVAAKIKAWLDDEDVVPESIAVLTRSQEERDRFVRGLGERGVKVRAVDRSAASSGPAVSDDHAPGQRDGVLAGDPLGC